MADPSGSNGEDTAKDSRLLGGRRTNAPLEMGTRVQRALVATDGSVAANAVVDIGLDFAIQRGATVTFVHVLPGDKAYGGPTLVVSNARAPLAA